MSPYSAPHWPAGTTAEQMAERRALAKGGCELNRSEEELARAIAMIGPARLTKLVPHVCQHIHNLMLGTLLEWHSDKFADREAA
jgi:hypothetical protein